MCTSKKIFASKLTPLILVIGFATQNFSQQAYTYEDAFNKKLQELNKEVTIRYQISDIEQEKYLLKFMNHLVNELRLRSPNSKADENSYYDNLENSLKEVDRLIPSLQNNKAQPNILKLARDLRDEIQTTISRDNVNENKRRKINKAIQMLSLIDNSLKKGENANAKQFSSTFESLLAKSSNTNSSSDKNAKIDEWEKNEILKFKLDENRLVYYQEKLLKFANASEKTRMAKDFFGRALYSFNTFEFKTAIAILENILEKYSFLKNKELIHYYLGLSYYYENNFVDAKFHLEKSLKNKNIDQYAAFILSKIYRVYKDLEGFKSLSQSFETLSRSKEDLSDDFYFTVGASFYELEKYTEAYNALAKVSATFNLYNDAQYMMSSITFTKNKQESKNQFQKLINRPDIHPELRNNSLLKLAYIAFENKEYNDALYWYDEINQDEFPDYEKVLLGKAWAYYEKEMLKPESMKKVFTETKHYTGLLINNYTSSDYLSEAKALLGYAKQKSDNVEGAEDEFKSVFESKAYKLLSDEYLTELDSLRQTKRRIEKLVNKSVEKNNMVAFKRLEDMKYEIDKKIYRLTYMDNASASPSNTKDFQIVSSQIKEFEQLREKAVAKKEDAIVKRIDDNLVRLYVVLNQFKVSNEKSIFGENFFKDQALARKVSLIENRNKNYDKMASETSLQKEYLKQKISDLKAKREEEVKKNNFKKVNQIDVTLYRLEKAENRLNSINTYSESKERYKLADNLDKWANYSAYQLTNLQYYQREQLDNQNQLASETISRINEVVRNRNIVLGEQIKQIDNRIVNLTRKETRERRIQERNQTRDLVNQTFYDKTLTEVNEDSVRFALESIATEREKLRKKLSGELPVPAQNDTTLNSIKAPAGTDSKKSGDEKSADETKTDDAVNKEEEQ